MTYVYLYQGDAVPQPRNPPQRVRCAVSQVPPLQDSRGLQRQLRSLRPEAEIRVSVWWGQCKVSSWHQIMTPCLDWGGGPGHVIHQPPAGPAGGRPRAPGHQGGLRHGQTPGQDQAVTPGEAQLMLHHITMLLFSVTDTSSVGEPAWRQCVSDVDTCPQSRVMSQFLSHVT